MAKRRTPARLARRRSALDPPIGPGQLLALFAAPDLEGLIDAAFPLLRSTVTCDFASAFYRSAGNGLLKSRDSRGRQYDAAFMRRSVERYDGHSDFSDRELANLELVHPFLDCAVNRLLEREAANNVSDTVRLVRDGAPGFAILDRDLGLIHASAVARRVCAAWGNRSGAALSGATSRAWRLPLTLAAGCRELQQEWRTAVRADPDTTGLRRRRVLHTHDPALTASITLVAPKSTGLAEPTFLLELDRDVRSPALDPSAAILQTLTRAECAVALVLADGLSNQEI